MSIGSRSCVRGSLAWIGVMLPLAAQIQAAQVQPFDRMVLATNVVCREQPSISSQGVGTLGLGDRFRTGDTRSEDGQSWILVVDRRSSGYTFGSCQRRLKMSQIWRLKMPHFDGR